MEFSLEKMGKRNASDVPGLSSLLGGICSGGKLGDGEMDDETGEGGIGVSGRGRLGVWGRGEAESESSTIAGNCEFACLLFSQLTANRGRLPSRICIILNTHNQKGNAFQVVIGIFLHSTRTPDHVVGALHCAGTRISSASISRAIKSMSAKMIELLATFWGALLLLYAYDNFDIQEKCLTPALETPSDILCQHSSSHFSMASFLNIFKCRRHVGNLMDSMMNPVSCFPEQPEQTLTGSHRHSG